MDEKTKRSAKQWIISFLLADVLFLIWLGIGCIFSSTSAGDCGEGTWFAAYFWSLPFGRMEIVGNTITWLDSWMEPAHSIARYWTDLFLLFSLAAVFHATIGLVFGILFRRHHARKWLSAIIAVSLVFGMVFILARSESQRNFETQTETHTWALYDFSSGTSPYTNNNAYRIEYANASIANDPGTPNGFRTEIQEVTRGFSWTDATELLKTRIFVLPYDATGEVGDPTLISADAFARALSSCMKLNVSCPYYGFAMPMLFVVTTSPNGIEQMVQRYVP